MSIIYSLQEETTTLLKQEVREPAIDLHSHHHGYRHQGQPHIGDFKRGRAGNECMLHLPQESHHHGYLTKRDAYDEKVSKQFIYSIDDNIFRFWYRFVKKIASMIARGATELVYKRIKPCLSDYMGKVIDEICE